MPPARGFHRVNRAFRISHFRVDRNNTWLDHLGHDMQRLLECESVKSPEVPAVKRWVLYFRTKIFRLWAQTSELGQVV